MSSPIASAASPQPAGTPHITAPHAAPGASDWTQGTPVLRVDTCVACGFRTALRQRQCARCGGAVDSAPIAGPGRVWSHTVVHRGPTKDETRDGPYAIALVDLAEGVRVMTRAETDLAIGDPVQVTLREVQGRLLPYASRAS